MGDVVVETVPDPVRCRGFFEMPWRVNQGDPDWVAPLRMAQRNVLNRKHYPFYQHGDACFFVARRNGEAVGRIAAIENRLHAQQYNDAVGFFGFFECDEDQAACTALLRHAAEWVRDKGYKTVRGPLNYSLNDECPGVLYEGFNGIPLLLMAHNPRYYRRLLESCGMRKAKDLYAYLVTRATVAGDRFQRVMKAVRRRAPALDISPVRMDRRGFREDLDTMLDVFNQAWVQNWGFVPVSPGESKAIAKDLKPIVRPEITAIARMEGKAVGMTVCVPNINEVLRKMPDGRLFPTGWFTLLNGLRMIRGFRTMMMGVLPEYRGKGVDAMMIDHVIRNGTELGFQYCELSWVLEDNEPMVSLADKAGGNLYRRYRLFEATTDELLA